MKPPHSSTSAGCTVQHLVLLLILCVLAGCSSVDSAIRMTPTTSLDSARVLGTNVVASANTNLPGGIRLYNVDPNGSFVCVSGVEALNPDLYVTVDVSPIVNKAITGSIDKQTRNNLVSFLIYLSDRNADVWESRVFAIYKTRQDTVATIRDLATAGAGASALIIPPVAAGLSAANLIVGPISDEIDSTLYSKDTVETMLKAISASRHTYKNTLRGNFTRELADYDMFEALDQVRHYDSLVSFRKGLAYAANLADNQTAKAENIENTNTGTGTPPPKLKAPTPAPAGAQTAAPAPAAARTNSLAPPAQ